MLLIVIYALKIHSVNDIIFNMSGSGDVKEYLNLIHDADYGLLCEIDRVCRLCGIHYYLAAGTLLGAVRHGDFIPWDDDADIVMPRKYYGRFMSSFREHADKRYELILPAEHDFFFDFTARIVDKEVTVSNPKTDKDYYGDLYDHPGVDIFVFDAAGPMLKARLLGLKLTYALAMGHRDKLEHQKYSGLEKLGSYILPAIGRQIKMKTLAGLYDRISNAKASPSADWHISNQILVPPYWGMIYKREWYENRSFKKLRDHAFPIPAGYDEMLRTLYGDYMQLPPEEKRKPEHFFA